MRPDPRADGLDRIQVGQTVVFRKTVTETDVYLFAGLSGDMHPNHIDEMYMRQTPYGRRIAHGALLVAYMSAASARFTERFPAPTVSYGYDRIRFIKPVFFGDTITVEYRIQSTNASELKAYAQVICTNQRGEVVAVATHLMQLIDGETNESS